MSARTSDRNRQPSQRPPMRFSNASPSTRFGHSNATKELKDVLERKIEDLSRQLTEERQTARHNKITLARVQRELARAKAHDKPVKEQLSKELEQERALRADAEYRLHEMTRESDACHARLSALQSEFKKMEGVVQDMLQYKTKIDQLKQEKSSLAVTYDNNISKFKKHITDLERENMVLLNDVKKLDCQINNKTDGRDRSKLLLERLKMLEGENSSLVLENEQQQGQYEKCLDEIANQVVQALLAQKMLREECVKLQGRVYDLEYQNKQLCCMFQHKMKMAAEVAAQQTANGEAISQELFLQGSMESLQSMFSEQMSENMPSVPRMSSPPPWLQERLAGDRRSIVSFTGSIASTPEFDLDYNSPPQQNEFQCRTEIETEFPATPSSPKSKHVSFIERPPETKRSSSTSSLTSASRGPNRPRTRSTSSLSRARGLSLFSPQPVASPSRESGSPNTTTNEQSSSNQEISKPANQEQPSSPIIANRNSVPLNQSNPSISNVSSQGQVGQSKEVSKVPVQPVGAKVKDETQIRRNSLKAEYSIRMGCQSVQAKSSQSSVSAKQQAGKLPAAKSKLPSMSTPGQSRTAKSGPPGSRIPMGSRQTGPISVPSKVPARETVNSKSRESVNSKSHESVNAKSYESVNSKSRESVNSKSNESVNSKSRESVNKKNATRENIHAKSTPDSGKTQKTKTGLGKLAAPSNSKLVPPKSPNLRYSGIRTTLKSESTSKTVTSTKSVTTVTNQGSSQVTTGVNSVSLKMRSVYAINPKLAKPSSEPEKRNDKKPALPARGEKPAGQRPETHYPIMGLTTLNHTSPKNETADAKYANLISSPTVISSTSVPSKETSYASEAPSAAASSNRGQYFYDYSDEDSDFNRPVSKTFSVASTISLDELLDQTLEGMDTPLDSDFKSDHFLFNVTVDENGKANESIKELVLGHKKGSDSKGSDKKSSGSENVGKSNNKIDPKSSEAEHRLHGKPDIVKDTEECEQRNLQKSLTISQIPGSSLPGYRAKRPKSLILGANEKKFLYCEYGSSSSSDTSEEEWSYQYSYAKNVKEQEIQSKVAKSLKNGQAKVIESPRDGTTKIDVKTVKTLNEVNEKQSSKLPKLNSAKKASKIPPPVASKPSTKKSSLHETSVGRPKSVEICVNTAIADVSVKTCSSVFSKFHAKDISKSDSDKCINMSGNVHTSMKHEHHETTLNSTFDEVKVERSGSKDDGYSTMSSDVQPEHMEKYSDVLESSTNSNDNIRTSNLSLSSQNSFSSEDRHSLHGSLGRVRAMKMKFDTETSKSPERESLSPKSPPMSPFKMQQMSPKRTLDTVKHQPKAAKENIKVEPSVPSIQSKLPVSSTNQNMSKEVSTSQKSAIPTPNSQTSKIAKVSGIPRKDKVEAKSALPTKTKSVDTTVQGRIPEQIVSDKMSVNVSSGKCERDKCTVQDFVSPNKSSGFDRIPQDCSTPKITVSDCDNGQNTLPQTSTPKNLLDQFSQLTYFAPTVDQLSLFPDPAGDSNSSLSSRGSDLTSLHISEDNILSDIPEEREGYESSVGHRSETNSVASIPGTSIIRKSTKQTAHHHSHTQVHSHTIQFKTTLRNYWSSIQGLVRAASFQEYERQKHARETADYEELYGGCLNIETLMERSSSESDMYTRGDKPAVILLPGLPRSRSTESIVIDELVVEEKVQAILKHDMMQQISKNVDSADKDEANFTSFVELLKQRGHVMEADQSPLQQHGHVIEADQSPLQQGRASADELSSDQTSQALNKMAVSTFSSNKGYNSGVDCFEGEEKEGRALQPDAVTSPTIVDDNQKKFNSQFYSLCNTGSSKSISDKSESQSAEAGKNVANDGGKDDLIHTCQKGDTACKKCEQEKNINEFDNISRQIESLSKTVNQLHKSLSSLNSENSDSGSESNEGDSVLTSAFGNKDIDGYQWVEDEFFLSPYGGEVILGGSPFSNTGASCDWMNEYTENVDNFEETGGQESMHDEPVPEISFDCHGDTQRNSNRNSVNSVLAGSMDKEGNFDSHSFISKRLEIEEQRLKSLQNNNKTSDKPVDNANIGVRKSRIPPPTALKLKTRPLLKEEMRTTPEKDVDDTASSQSQQKPVVFETTTLSPDHYGSQDSLDDNIGVDNVMCHRLIGGKAGQNAAARPNPSSRPALDFSQGQFVRYSDPEKQAVAAFDFLNEMSSSIASDQSQGRKLSRDQLSRASDQSQGLKLSRDQLSRLEEQRAMIAANRNRMNYSTTSTESKTSPVKRPRRKLRPKVRKDQRLENVGSRRASKFSSTSADESNGDDFYSESDSDECAAADDIRTKVTSKVMTYI